MNNSDTAPKQQLPAYRSTKTVWALKIASVQVGLWHGATMERPLLAFEDETFMPRIERANFGPGDGRDMAGGYWVQYQDGYTSWSPADQFEAGNVLASDWGIPYAQEPKYNLNNRGRMVNRESNEAIPDDEPTFTFRARDRKAVHALCAYALVVDQPDHGAVVRWRIDAFNRFAAEHPDRMKEPDSPLSLIRARAADAVDLESDAPLARAAEPKGNGETCESCQ